VAETTEIEIQKFTKLSFVAVQPSETLSEAKHISEAPVTTQYSHSEHRHTMQDVSNTLSKPSHGSSSTRQSDTIQHDSNGEPTYFANAGMVATARESKAGKNMPTDQIYPLLHGQLEPLPGNKIFCGSNFRRSIVNSQKMLRHALLLS
jgi:hypothetical protein